MNLHCEFFIVGSITIIIGPLFIIIIIVHIIIVIVVFIIIIIVIIIIVVVIALFSLRCPEVGLGILNLTSGHLDRADKTLNPYVVQRSV